VPPATGEEPKAPVAAKKTASKPTVGREPKPRPAAKVARAKRPAAAPAKDAAAPTPKPGKKTAKPRPVLVRDSFTMPEADFALIGTLKATALAGQRAAKKSELLRAGLKLLAGLDTESLVVVLNQLDTVKTGRPKKGH
jgi:hypothetical protein